jgi:hypothetical protein
MPLSSAMIGDDRGGLRAASSLLKLVTPQVQPWDHQMQRLR